MDVGTEMAAGDRHGAFETGGTGCAEVADLGGLETYLGDCHRCPLGDTRTRLVFGVGDPHAGLMFIGEAPGRNEDLRGEPFVGAAGKLLDELLASIGLVRSQVYIANVLKCRPPGNRDPLALEIETCVPFLAEQVRLIAPRVIATLGNFATRCVLDTDRGITQLRGRLFQVDGRRVVPIYHPAAALYDQTKRGVLFEDLQRLRRVLDTPDELPTASVDDPRPAAAAADAATTGTPTPAASGPQPTLF